MRVFIIAHSAPQHRWHMLRENRTSRNRFDRPAVKVAMAVASVAAALFVANRTIAPPQGMVPAAVSILTNTHATPVIPIAPDYRWMSGSGTSDDVRGHRFNPNGWYRQHFDTNPRGYFSNFESGATLLLRDWTVRCADRRGIRVIDPYQSDRLRLVLDDSDPQSLLWTTISVRRPVPLPAGQTASVEVSISADPPRDLTLQFSFPAPEGERVEEARFHVGNEVTRLVHCAAVAGAAVEFTCRILLGKGTGDVWVSELSLNPAPSAPDVERPFYVNYELNRLGFRERELPEECPSGTIRIACLGDSNTFGQGVHFEDTYPQVLERMCNDDRATGSPKVEALNFGIPGYATDAEYDVYIHDAERFGAKIVFVQLCWNDALSTVEDVRLFTETGVTDARKYCDALAKIIKEQGYARTIDYLRRLRDRCAAHGVQLVVGMFNTRLGAEWDQMVAEVVPAMRAVGVPVFDVGDLAVQEGHEGESGIVHPSDHHPSEKGHLLFAREIKRILDENHLLPTAADVALIPSE